VEVKIANNAMSRKEKKKKHFPTYNVYAKLLAPTICARKSFLAHAHAPVILFYVFKKLGYVEY
jgi:hypothetical protein